MLWHVLSILVTVTLVSSLTTDYLPFRNTSLDWDVRVNDLVNRLTLQEIILQMAMGGGGTYKPAPAIPRLNISAYQYDTECLHGVMTLPTTAFPQSLALAATFSEDLLYMVAEAIGTEARAVYNYASAHGDYSLMKGISCFAPFINLMRHPLWGRVQEVNGEDPYLSGLLAAAYVKGMQGPDPRFVRASSGCKVVGLYSGPENIPESRFTFNAVASERDFRLSYFPQFKACIDAGTYNLMCSFYSINGIPGCTHKWLLTDVMRKEFGFRGYIITDWGAINETVHSHKYYSNYVEAAAGAANAGVNLELPDVQPIYLHLMEAVQQGLVTTDTIVELVKPLFYTRMRLGEFDPPATNPYASISQSVIENAVHRELAVVAAANSFVLLKNEGGLLPLTSKVNRLAVLGPFADDLEAMLGNYAPAIQPQFSTTPLAGLRQLATTVDFVKGCNNAACAQYNSTAVISATLIADIVVLCLGTGSGIETENSDRSTLDLPGHQSDLLVDAFTSAKKPVILLLFTAGPVNISVAKSNWKVAAVMLCFYPGQGGGEALRRVLAVGDGNVVSPAARLPFTWPASLTQVPPITNYSMEGRTYRYFKGPGAPLYPFGYGLSYSSFKYFSLVVTPTIVKAGTNVTVQVTLASEGPYRSYEVVQVYISWRDCPVVMPQRQLVAVKRISLASLETKTVVMNVSADQLRVWDDKKGFIFYTGYIDVYVGGQQPNQETIISSNVLHTQIQTTADDVGRGRTASTKQPWDNWNLNQWNNVNIRPPKATKHVRVPVNVNDIL